MRIPTAFRRPVGWLRSKFWFLPLLMVIGALFIAAGTLELDLRAFTNLRRSVFWLFEGQADAARSLLSVIAGSLITVISISYSITLIAIQQAATQYSPRIIEHFRRDLASRLVLGTYLATFTFSLIILQVVRAPSSAGAGDQFVPALSVNLALLLALVSIVMLAFFIHHIIQMIQVSSILEIIRASLDREIADLFPNPATGIGASVPTYREEIEAFSVQWPRVAQKILLEKDGYFKSVDLERLARLGPRLQLEGCWIIRSIGEYLTAGTPLVELHGRRVLTPAELRRVLGCLEFGTERTVRQDALYGVRQITDIAIKALSPGVNDPTTAEQCLCELKGGIAHLMGRAIPSCRFQRAGVDFLVNRPDFGVFVGKAFDQIIRNSRSTFDVMQFLVNGIIDLLAIADGPRIIESLEARLHRILDDLDATSFTPSEREKLRARISEGLSDEKFGRSGRNVSEGEQAA